MSIAKTSVHRCNIGLNINEIQEVIPQRQPLKLHNDNISEKSNSEYHKPKGRPSKRYKVTISKHVVIA